MSDSPAYQPAPQAPAGASAPVPGKTLGIVALILAFFFQLLGLILGIVALVQSRKVGAKNTPALWAIILSIVFMVIGSIIAIVIVSSLGSALAMCSELGTGVHDVNGVTVTCG
ncbi:DUF4190 domain-containing protein [Microbacterium schleiferi]|uniref:DUF4190 domain-containing protein n=1 Tax=Microbacterium schleiferi TaxID=69362 RepID=UPI001D1711D8|nr:DUF4190 domain-containing protein [Microbacterium schleiferi]MCC4267222.1 DUF4190 domain-containing protein [Microbacterium schleiferi]